ncbi:OmpA family protein [Fortiea sp. LEGE XX443]|uniref:OmpA family protein n=1 Tax=Fortiea sp. LEGE XX443 TaxID=1828611 RepID=UPI0018821BC4|nr:OmpA family protein [Fortiea sp. LEGE XX443]MBE9006538.1 OmpA family protein [Fortiea sp. LEGE XX443]
MNDYSPKQKFQISSEAKTNNDQSSNLNSPNQEANLSDELSLLRSVLLGVEPTQLNKLYERLNNPQIQPEDISRLLPEAVVLRSKQDKQLVESIVSTVEEAIQASVSRDENVLSEAFFPVIGPATRKAIATALDEMMQSLNQTLEHSLSPESFKWRLEARRTGKSFAEIVLLRTLVYRVEQIFLIHKKTGLLLHHVITKQVAVQDPDLVAAMLTAIQDFVKDSFSVQKEDTLRSLRFGELTIWIEEGPQALLAGIIRGKPPQELRQVFQDAIEKIHLKLGTEFHEFVGETEPFQPSQAYLENCLTVKFKSASQQNYTYAWALLGIVAIAGGIWGFFTIREHIRWQTYIQKLDSQPGIVVINTQHRNGKHFILGMRDPLAIDPNTLIQQTNLNPKTVIGQWQTYLSLEPQLLTKRTEKILQPPTTVSLKVDNNGVLSAIGYAPQKWILAAQKLWRFVPGVTQFQDKNLLISELRELELAKQQIEQTIFLFSEGKTDFIPGETNKLPDLAKIVQRLLQTAKSLDHDVQIQIRGHTDTTGTERENLLLSQARANKILAYLNFQKINPNKFKLVALGSNLPFRPELTSEAKMLNRRVSFQISIIDKPK